MIAFSLGAALFELSIGNDMSNVARDDIVERHLTSGSWPGKPRRGVTEVQRPYTHRLEMGPVGFEPTTKGFTWPRRFRQAWTISSPAHVACGWVRDARACH